MSRRSKNSVILDGRTEEARGVLEVIGKSLLSDGSPTPQTISRAETAAKVFHANPGMFGRVVVSGLYQRDFTQELLPAGASEAAYQKEVLVRQGVPEEFIRVDSESTTTFANAYTPRMLGLFEGVVLDDEHPFALVAGYPHVVRAGIVVRRAHAIPSSLFLPVVSPGENNVKTFARELVGIAATRLALIGVVPGDLYGVQAAEDRYHAMIDRLARSDETDVTLGQVN
jgi:hypothetical protein